MGRKLAEETCTTITRGNVAIVYGSDQVSVVSLSGSGALACSVHRGAEAARRVHGPEVAGSIPAGATSRRA